ncbi:hypothetical protein B0J13DRAFT_135172 [Dactylonectria estremocensis]|uniref:Uncharacterized protein n=1 Tax=Dactylonectria estremocensis TaxID=1079267 RepID=A0A9P9E208_9HYPO|nr:hypothetical protein B0J13DRAFT_135172 [Dactylonectria estremocensis]
MIHRTRLAMYFEDMCAQPTVDTQMPIFKEMADWQREKNHAPLKMVVDPAMIMRIRNHEVSRRSSTYSSPRESYDTTCLDLHHRSPVKDRKHRARIIRTCPAGDGPVDAQSGTLLAPWRLGVLAQRDKSRIYYAGIEKSRLGIEKAVLHPLILRPFHITSGASRQRHRLFINQGPSEAAESGGMSTRPSTCFLPTPAFPCFNMDV